MKSQIGMTFRLCQPSIPIFSHQRPLQLIHSQNSLRKCLRTSSTMQAHLPSTPHWHHWTLARPMSHPRPCNSGMLTFREDFKPILTSGRLSSVLCSADFVLCHFTISVYSVYMYIYRHLCAAVI